MFPSNIIAQAHGASKKALQCSAKTIKVMERYNKTGLGVSKQPMRINLEGPTSRERVRAKEI